MNNGTNGHSDETTFTGLAAALEAKQVEVTDTKARHEAAKTEVDRLRKKLIAFLAAPGGLLAESTPTPARSKPVRREGILLQVANLLNGRAINADVVAKTLKCPKESAYTYLSALVASGKAKRVAPGLYVKALAA